MTMPSTNPLRKQTLLGIAPVGTVSEAPAAQGAEPEPLAFTPAPEPPPPQGMPLVVPPAARGSLHKQTLLGIAPVSVAPPATSTEAPAPVATEQGLAPDTLAAATASAEVAPPLPVEPALPPLSPALPSPADVAPVATEAQSYTTLVTPTTSKTDAPTTSDVVRTARAPGPARSPSAVNSSADEELPELRKKRPRWLAPLAVAAVLALGVAGLRSLDRPPTPAPVAAERAKTAPANPAPATPTLGSAPIEKATDDDGEDREPTTDTGPTTAPDSEPLKANADAAPSAVAPGGAPPGQAKASAAAGAASPSGDKVRVNVDSDPPGARLFWKGKEVGTTPFVLELDPGERHAYELGLPGHITRKVVIDGSKPEIKIGLRPDSKPAPGTNLRK